MFWPLVVFLVEVEEDLVGNEPPTLTLGPPGPTEADHHEAQLLVPPINAIEMMANNILRRISRIFILIKTFAKLANFSNLLPLSFQKSPIMLI